MRTAILSGSAAGLGLAALLLFRPDATPAREERAISPSAGSVPTANLRKNVTADQPTHFLIAPNFYDETDSLDELAASFTGTRLRLALESLASQPRGAGLALGCALLRRWAAHAPDEAARWTATLPKGPFQQMAVREVTAAWATADFASASAWVDNLPNDNARHEATLCLADEALAHGDPPTALTLAGRLPPADNRDQLLDRAVLQWAAADRSAAITWTEAVPDARLREAMLGKIVTDWAVMDPPGAAAFASTALPPDDLRDAAVLHIVRCWAPLAPEQAATWVGRFPKGPLRDEAIENLIAVWQRTSPSAAAAWAQRLSTQPASPF